VVASRLGGACCGFRCLLLLPSAAVGEPQAGVEDEVGGESEE